MKKYINILFVLCLAGCANTTPASESIANSAQASIDAISQTLTPECKTKAIESQINAAQTAVKATIKACDSEKEIITQEKLRWKYSFLALAIIVLVHVLQKVSK
jgi:outer membrane lipoprotein SlyB